MTERQGRNGDEGKKATDQTPKYLRLDCGRKRRGREVLDSRHEAPIYKEKPRQSAGDRARMGSSTCQVGPRSDHETAGRATNVCDVHKRSFCLRSKYKSFSRDGLHDAVTVIVAHSKTAAVEGFDWRPSLSEVCVGCLLENLYES